MNAKIGIAVVGVLGLSAWFWSGSSQVEASRGANVGEVFKVRRDELRISITENGTMVAKESNKVKPKIKGEGKITFLIEEGKQVEENEVICKLDPTAVESQIESLQLEVLSTEAALKTARTELEIQEVENVATLAKAVVALDRSGKEREKYVDGEAPQQRKKLQVAIKDTDTDFNRAQKNLEDSKKLLEQDFIKKSELEEHEIAYERAVVQREGANLDLKIFDKYTYPMQMTDLNTKMTDAKREVETASKRGDSVLGQKKVSVQQSEKRLKAQQKQLEERQEDLTNMSIVAPCPGIVLYGDPHQPWYREQIKVGGQVWGGHVVMTIPDLRVMQVNVQVHEADIDKVKVDQTARVTMDTYPGLVLAGKVSKIASVAGGQSDWGGSSEVKKFGVEITIEGEGLEKTLRPGISAKAEIEIDTRPEVMFVPLQSVFAEDGEQYCHVMGPDRRPERRKVVIGPANENYVEITSGLKEGEEVLLWNPMLPDAKKPSGDGGNATDGKAAETSGVPETAGSGDSKS